MAKKRFRNCGWCGQKIVSQTRELKELKEHLERQHGDFQHKRL